MFPGLLFALKDSTNDSGTSLYYKQPPGITSILIKGGFLLSKVVLYRSQCMYIVVSKDSVLNKQASIL